MSYAIIVLLDSLMSLVLLVKPLGAVQPTTIGGKCKQYPGNMADSYPINYDITAHLVFFIYGLERLLSCGHYSSAL